MSYEVELRKCVSELRDSEIEDVLEFLYDNKLLNDAGEKMAKRFWKKYIKEKRRRTSNG